MLGHDDLYNVIQTDFTMVHNFNYTIEDLNNMMPWERTVWIELLRQWIEQQEKKKQG